MVRPLRRPKSLVYLGNQPCQRACRAFGMGPGERNRHAWPVPKMAPIRRRKPLGDCNFDKMTRLRGPRDRVVGNSKICPSGEYHTIVEADWTSRQWWSPGSSKRGCRQPSWDRSRHRLPPGRRPCLSLNAVDWPNCFEHFYDHRWSMPMAEWRAKESANRVPGRAQLRD